MKVNYYIRKNRNNCSQSYIEASFSWNGNRLKITTKESILKKNWNKRPKNGNYVLPGQDFANHINKRLDDIKKWAGDLYYERKNKREPLHKDEFKRLFIENFHLNEEETRPARKTVIERFKEVAEQKAAIGSRRTGQAYQTLIKYLDEYLNSKDISNIHELDQNICEGFISYLIQKRRSNRTING